MKPDFSGWATKNDIVCSDGRVIKHNAFAKNNGKKVPLVWQHEHKDINNIIGHALLENRNDGMYTYGYLNDTPQADVARGIIKHGDVNSLSIFANKIKQVGNDVVHGNIIEVSLVLSGANPGAFIENVSIQHSDGVYYESEDEAIIHADIELDPPKEEEAPAEEPQKEDKSGEKTVKEVMGTLNEDQKDLFSYLLAEFADQMVAEQESEESSDNAEGDNEETNNSEEKDEMAHSNVFEKEGSDKIMKHAEFIEIGNEAVSFAVENKMTLSDAVKHVMTDEDRDEYIKHAASEISGLDVLFPNAKVDGKPTWIKPEDDWVAEVVDKTSHTPFSRLKMTHINVDDEMMRALGYKKGDKKSEGIYKLLSRETSPQTIYVKSKLDRDDILDATGQDVVGYTRETMRVMFRREIARAILIGDGRSEDDANKIKDNHIRPIYSDDDLYATKYAVPAGTKNEVLPDMILRAQKNYKGHGVPTLFTTYDVFMDMLLAKDKIDSNRRLYTSVEELCSAMRVSKIVVVDLFDGLTRTDKDGKVKELVGIVVNLRDYNIGRDNGGEVFNADDFDIDFNQYIYLMESRMSGALMTPKSAVVIERLQS